ncbi:MAG: hypothetical protein CMN58_06830 [Solibacterales bacterium]|nr:hypothetical protein [Bryobacterales bacterium]|tara:strand:+ start:4263 stop:6569 length:2307 start_codon:yes stop_codon:yes gene_type:complete
MQSLSILQFFIYKMDHIALMRHLCTMLVGLFLSGYLHPSAVAQQNNPDIKIIHAHKITTPPQLDGSVTESLWKTIEPATNFIQRNPDEGHPATEETEIRIGYDDKNLYFGIICFDSQPENIVITQNRRDAKLDDTDSILILLDTFDDDQNAFLFGTTPTGVEADAQISKAGRSRGGSGSPRRAGGGAQRGGSSAFNVNWDAVWEVRSKITSRGWESEIIIPFRTLRYTTGTNQKWGLNFQRTLRRRNEKSHWAPISRSDHFVQVDRAGDLYGLDVRSHRNLKLLPYVLGGLSQDYTATGDQRKIQRDIGLDVKYSVTPGLTLDLTVNTDFAQVEVDDEQINLTRFDLFFPEKRPFFLENSGFFDFGASREVELFFSRRIGLDENRQQVPIDAGARLSGKVGPYQIGVLNIQTSGIGDLVSANNYSVARFSRELPNRSSIGVIGVNRQSVGNSDTINSFNRTYGADANFGIGAFGNWFNVVAKTDSPHLTGSDHVYSSRFEYDDSAHTFHLGFLEVGHNFNPEVGFVRRTGFRKASYYYRLSLYPKSGPIRSVEPHVLSRRWYTLGTNEFESGFSHYHTTTYFHDGSSLGLAWNRSFERLDEPFEVVPNVHVPIGRYHFDEVIANFSTDQSATFFTGGDVAKGAFYDGTIRSINVKGGYRYSKNVTWIGSWTRNLINLPVGDVTTDLTGLRFNWSFTSKSFLQTLSQYNSVTGKISHNIRLGILSTSSTGFFFVFNTTGLTRDFLDPHDIQRRTLSRALFFKFNYLLDY